MWRSTSLLTLLLLPGFIGMRISMKKALREQGVSSDLSEHDIIAIHNGSSVSSGPSDAKFTRIREDERIGEDGKDECFARLEKYGAHNLQELGEPFASGHNGQAWCVTKPGSRVPCQRPCVPSSVANPSCLILRRTPMNRKYLNTLENQFRSVADIQIQMAQKGIAPAVEEMWQCDSPQPGNEDEPSEIWLAMGVALGKTLKTIVKEKGLVTYTDRGTFKVKEDKAAVHAALERECAAIFRAISVFHHPSQDTYVMHRDLHWDNIFVNGNDATLIDFDSAGVLTFEMGLTQAKYDLKFYAQGFCQQEGAEYLKTYITTTTTTTVLNP
mmetsp:Transcript_117199/g.183144  ORF Transcript_117199/g.183144 Transcript_117199/m.183144 type:complete len:327 (-) Transcript_117199:97-1077(-)